ncbi:MAG: CoA-binding protein [Blastocatellia bacterium]|nr:CoA-binding protein [Blastocatellia bacterium]
MSKLPVNVDRFLSVRRIAVAGVSRDPMQAANNVYRKLKAAGYQVFAVNPNATEVEGDPCYPTLAALPEAVEAVVIVTRPELAAQLVRECGDLGIGHVWLHRSFGEGSVSDEAIRECERLGINCLTGGCPVMYCAPVDFGHRCMRWILRWQGRVPG